MSHFKHSGHYLEGSYNFDRLAKPVFMLVYMDRSWQCFGKVCSVSGFHGCCRPRLVSAISAMTLRNAL